jgi:hypothetical protein
MKRTNWMSRTFVVVLALALAVSAGWANQEGKEQGKKAKVELPAAVVKAIKDNVPNAEIDIAEVEKEAGIALYDIEFKAGRGEIEVAEDGTVMDIATIVALKGIPKLAAEAIRRAAAGAKIQQVEKSEVRAEIKKEGEKATIVKLVPPKYVYEAELIQGEKRGEVQVAPDGTIVEGPKWGADEAKEEKQLTAKEEAEEEEKAEEEEEEEEEEAEEAGQVVMAKPGVDLKILPPAVLDAFKRAYPKAVIRGASEETEKGVTYYEVESVDGKMNRDLLYTADGKAVEVEEAIAPGALPPAVLQTLAKVYPGYKIIKAEDILKDGQKLFELQIQVNGKKMGMTIDPNGKIIE